MRGLGRIVAPLVDAFRESNYHMAKIALIKLRRGEPAEK